MNADKAFQEWLKSGVLDYSNVSEESIAWMSIAWHAAIDWATSNKQEFKNEAS